MKRAMPLMFVIVFASALAFAQDKPAQDSQTKPERSLSFYKIEYVLRELQDGKAVNSRNYMLTVENGDRGEAKVGAKVPIVTGMNGVTQYMDVGVNIGCRVVGREDYLSLRTSIELSSFALPEQTPGQSMQPVVRQMRTEMAAVVPLNKQTVIGIVDDVNSTKRYEVAVTATRLK